MNKKYNKQKYSYIILYIIEFLTVKQIKFTIVSLSFIFLQFYFKNKCISTQLSKNFIKSHHHSINPTNNR